MADDLGDRERSDETDRAALGGLTGGHTREVERLLTRTEVDTHVVERLDAGGVLEVHVGVLLGGGDHRVAEAE